MLLTEQNNKCNARVQVSYGMPRNYFCVKEPCLYVRDNHRKNLQDWSCSKERQLNWEKPREVEGISYKQKAR